MSFLDECHQKVEEVPFFPTCILGLFPWECLDWTLWKTCCANYPTILIIYSLLPIFINLLSFNRPFRENFVQKENKMNNNAFF